MLPVRILGTGSVVPQRSVSTAEVARVAMPDRDPEQLEARIGIQTRRWWGDEHSAVDVSADALRLALDAAGVDAGQLRAVIYTSSIGGDRLVPSTASPIAAQVGAGPDCACFDVNNACLGFLTSFDLATRLVQSLQAPVAVVAVEVFHRYLDPATPRSYVVFGDAAAATVIGPASTGAMLASDFGNDGNRIEATTLHVEALTGKPEQIQFGVAGRTITGFALADMQLSIDRVLEHAGHRIDDIDWFLPHQPNGAMFDMFIDRFGGPRARTHKVVHELGSLGAASVPVALDRAWRDPDGIRDGQLLLLAAVGAGSSRGALLLRIQR